ncbi:GNAT family N-acetyltransferase [Paenibacillus barcinonensis]|uniref:GNAT family N-acetyltransferase n=1 Tax=Paenibacillus barcinonensis TaxID=198119 RepID=A0ABX6Q7H7_PAEBA|nr:GNAT family N-acetyltransferase [Paenibacillus barcinonensis]
MGHFLFISSRCRTSYYNPSSEKAQGNGIVTKCIKTIIKYLFEDLNINRIEIHVAANNLKSIAITKRLGFTQESIKHDGQWLYDHYEDLIIFRILKREWEQ